MRDSAKVPRRRTAREYFQHLSSSKSSCSSSSISHPVHRAVLFTRSPARQHCFRSSLASSRSTPCANSICRSCAAWKKWNGTRRSFIFTNFAIVIFGFIFIADASDRRSAQLGLCARNHLGAVAGYSSSRIISKMSSRDFSSGLMFIHHRTPRGRSR